MNQINPHHLVMLLIDDANRRGDALMAGEEIKITAPRMTNVSYQLAPEEKQTRPFYETLPKYKRRKK